MSLQGAPRAYAMPPRGEHVGRRAAAATNLRARLYPRPARSLQNYTQGIR